jgi:Beta/Gamma crystallin
MSILHVPPRVLFSLAVLGIVLVPTLLVTQERQIGGIGLTVFAERNFRGRSATFREDIADLRTVGLNDRVSSLRVGANEFWEVCEHVEFLGRCLAVSGSEPDLRRVSWHNIISSARRVRAGGRGRGGGGIGLPVERPQLVLFDSRQFRGRSFNVGTGMETLSGFANRAESLRVVGPGWQICDRPRFAGRCETVSQDVGDLRPLGMANRVASARPVRRPR